jgi:hypothetical protein
VQGKVFNNNFISGMDFEKVANLRKIYEWVQQHTEICHLYAELKDDEEKIKLQEKIELSLDFGKKLLECAFTDSFHVHRSPMIPLSGFNRFAPASMVSDAISLAKHEVTAAVSNQVSNAFKSELGTVCNMKKIPMPSRTYLKKK